MEKDHTTAHLFKIAGYNTCTGTKQAGGFIPHLNPGYIITRVFKSLCVVIVFLLQGLSKIHAQKEMDYAVHANIIYRFTKYINWPNDKKNDDFVIGIVGDTQFYQELKGFIANKTASSQKIIVKEFSPSASSFNCQILFIGEDKSNSLKKILIATAGSSILIVTELDGLARKGSCINFIIVNDHLKLEINKNNIEHRKLGIATELLSLGILIK